EEIQVAAKALWAFNRDVQSQYGLCPLLWHPKWIPVLESTAGSDFICVDMVGSFGGPQGQVLELVHDSEGRTALAISLVSFVGSLSESGKKPKREKGYPKKLDLKKPWGGKK